MTLTKLQLVKNVAEEVGCSQKKAREIIAALLNAIHESLADGEGVAIRNFGKFYIVGQNPREINHPVTGGKIKVDKKNIVKFKGSSRLLEDLDVEEWWGYSEHNRIIFQELYALIENAVLCNEDEEELMYYPGKYNKVS